MFLSALWQNPPHTFFENQEPNEKIILLLRAHLITLVPATLLILILILAPIVVLTITSNLGLDLTQFLSPSLLTLILASWYLFTAGYAGSTVPLFQ